MAKATIVTPRTSQDKRVFIGGKPTVRSLRATPFKIQFRTANLDGYGPTNPAPIGIAIIGYNNYIL